MKSISLVVIAAGALALVACGGNSPVADKAENAGSLPAPNSVRVSDPSGAAPPANAASRQMPGASSGRGSVPAIPASLHGRWGLNPEDCIADQGDNRGVLQIGPGAVRFHESVARPVANANTSEGSYSADFAFTGEGQSWTKFETLRLKDGKLVRTESTPMASYTYARCT